MRAVPVLGLGVYSNWRLFNCFTSVNYWTEDRITSVNMGVVEKVCVMYDHLRALAEPGHRSRRLRVRMSTGLCARSI
jgi:hypothetical protein